MTRCLSYSLLMVAFFSPSLAWGQTTGRSTTSSMGSSGGTSTTAASSGLSGSTSSSSFGAGAFGTSFGKTGTPMTAQDFGGAGAGNLLRGSLNQSGLGGFGGIGGMNAMGLGAMGGFGRMGMGMGGMGMGGMGGMQGMNNNANNRNPRANLKFPTKLGFSVPATTMATRAVQFESRLRRLPGVASSKNVTVKVDGQVAILEGKVASEHERSIIERLAKMEPGISAVQNQLEVIAEVPADSTNSVPLPPPPQN